MADMMRAPGDGPTGLVLAGGGARGAYEVGVLAELLPVLEKQEAGPELIVGTSVGSLHAAWLAAHADDRHFDIQGLTALWDSMQPGTVSRPLLSFAQLRIAARGLLRPFGVRLPWAALDTSPLRELVASAVSWPDIARNTMTDSSRLRSVGVVATAASTGRSVVFHQGGASPPQDRYRRIDYVATVLSSEHVLASSAMPGGFPAVHVETEGASGWYIDGGTRLNTPIKPAIDLGAHRLVVIGLNSVARTGDPELRPDAAQGLGHLAQAILADPLDQDMATVATVNRILAHSEMAQSRGPADSHRRIPYIYVAPRRADAIGEIAMEVFARHYRGWRGLRRSHSVALLGGAVDASASALHGELLSYFLFVKEFARDLMALGRQDARDWISSPHDDGLWQYGPFPGDCPD
jgi:NTE family protein